MSLTGLSLDEGGTVPEPGLTVLHVRPLGNSKNFQARRGWILNPNQYISPNSYQIATLPFRLPNR